MASSGKELDNDFLHYLAKLHAPASGSSSRLKWYLTVTVALGGMHYPELIPDLYKSLLTDFILESEHKAETRKLREGLTKACGIWGAAKTGSATRWLASAIPEHLDDKTCYRENDSREVAHKRGQEMLDSIYPKIPGYDTGKVERTAPDYAWIAHELLYGHVFSFPAILGQLETGQVIITALASTDCQEQLRNHMMGMMINGATREEVQGVRAVVMALAERLGVRFKEGRETIEVPHPPGSSRL
ncbi:hypothetical protein NA57DRAFT_71367 [Rhizodiscina lignyota]|uniref:Carboxymuconolactone decarboxylase-like domain-containing protein n=1 Tax=Rhizodiscina lignyota TaxID=1504668 RepID=A0A9P4IN98_9PEZI|nr:hypothetical protein NA57DRAFT_71367 [Rhizodiscina lignyota]